MSRTRWEVSWTRRRSAQFRSDPLDRLPGLLQNLLGRDDLVADPIGQLALGPVACPS
jgi:hypothetical protein